MEHKFNSLRGCWDKRKGIKWLLTLSCCSLMFSLSALKNLPGAVIVDLIPACGLEESVGVEYIIDD